MVNQLEFFTLKRICENVNINCKQGLAKLLIIQTLERQSLDERSISNEFRPFRRQIHRFECPNSGAHKTLLKFSFFSCISTKKIRGSGDQGFHNASNPNYLVRNLFER